VDGKNPNGPSGPHGAARGAAGRVAIVPKGSLGLGLCYVFLAEKIHSDQVVSPTKKARAAAFQGGTLTGKSIAFLWY